MSIHVICVTDACRHCRGQFLSAISFVDLYHPGPKMLATPPPVVFSPPLDERNSEHLSSSLPPFPSPARVSSTEPEKKTPPKRKPVSEIISQALPPFDHQSSVVEPFGRLAEQDAEFQKRECRLTYELYSFIASCY